MTAVNDPRVMRKLHDALKRLRGIPTRAKRYDDACKAFEAVVGPKLPYDLMLWIAEKILSGGKPTVKEYDRMRASPARQRGGHV